MIYMTRLYNLRRNNFNGADVVHFTNVYTPKRHRKIAFVSTVHDLDAINFPDTYPAIYRLYFDKIVRDLISRTDLILADSEAVGCAIKEKYSLSDDRVRAVGIGISTSFMKLADEIQPSRVGGPPIMLYVGSLSKKKNTAWLVQNTVKGVRSGAIRSLRLILAGSPGFGFEEVELALRNTHDIVDWIKSPDMSQLVRLYKEADIVVLPSITEGFGIPLIEAMYCRKPIVASNIPSSVEVASSAAEFFDLNDSESFYNAITLALNESNVQARTQFVEKHITRFMWSHLTTKYIEAYQDAQCRH